MTQKEALDLLKMGHSVFLTGPAGSGKTYLLNQYIAYLRAHTIPVGITASTGIASTHMGGTTIHSWSGIGIHDALGEKDIKNLLGRPYLRNRFKKTNVLLIDEISMLHAHRLDLVDMLCRAFKSNDQPFGGMQVIMSGDFFQLPPVTKSEKSDSRNEKLRTFNERQTAIDTKEAVFEDTAPKTDFVTESHIWNNMQLKICYLEEQYRQDDGALLRILNDIRNNEVSEMTVEYLQERMQKDTAGYVNPTRLFTHNADVDAINIEQLDDLTGETKEFLMSWRGNFALSETLKKSCLAPATLVLKIGAQVMFVKNNYEAGYVNGTLGEVINFADDGSPIIRTYAGNEIKVGREEWIIKEDDKELAAIVQYPLRLAWAITVHKSQGMSLDAAEIDLKRSFLPGMGYVALSRVRTLSGLKLLGMNQMALQINPIVSEMDKVFLQRSNEAIMELQSLEKERIAQRQKDYLHFLTQ